MPFDSTAAQNPRVSIVGAGPGDPDLLTVKALRLITSAQVIFYDALISDEIRALFPSSAEKIYVGKRCGEHSFSQQEICNQLAKAALTGQRVVRLKGGDPFVFGRGGEEVLALAAHGVSTDVIPGITAAVGCSASAGIPLTHRGLSQGCTFVTAHARSEDSKELLAVDWSALAASNNTLVFYMGSARPALITEQLMNSGMSGAMPVAVVENGCTHRQRVFQGTLETLEALINSHRVKAPALIYVGEVVSFMNELSSLTQKNINSHQLVY